MPGFRYCSWCNGKGCMCCEAEQAKFAEKAKASAPKWREPDVRDVRDAALAAESKRLESLIGSVGGPTTQAQFRAMEAEAHAKIEAHFKPALDAEYARQFPDGPKPIFTMNRSNPADLALLKSFAGGPVLNRVFADGVTKEATAEMLRLADKARLTQAARQTLCPTDEDEATKGS